MGWVWSGDYMVAVLGRMNTKMRRARRELTTEDTVLTDVPLRKVIDLVIRNHMIYCLPLSLVSYGAET